MRQRGWSLVTRVLSLSEMPAAAHVAHYERLLATRAVA